jgi:integrase
MDSQEKLWTKTKEGKRKCIVCLGVYSSKQSYFNHLKTKNCVARFREEARVAKEKEASTVELVMLPLLREIRNEIGMLREEIKEGKYAVKEGEECGDIGYPQQLEGAKSGQLKLLEAMGIETNLEPLAKFLCLLSNNETKRHYIKVLVDFCRFAHEPPVYADYLDYFVQLKGNLTVDTVKGYGAKLRSFLSSQFNWKRKHFAKIDYTKFRVGKAKRVPDMAEIKKFIKGCASFKEKVFVWFALTTGQRLSDVLSAKVSNLDPHINGTYVITIVCRKTQKIARKCISSRLNLYLLKIAKDSNSPIFSDYKAWQIRAFFESISAATGIKITPKSLRAAHGSIIGPFIQSAKTALSHSSAATSEAHYVDPSIYCNAFDVEEELFVCDEE